MFYFFAYLRRTINQQSAAPKVLYMSFDKILLAIESRDLYQADKILIRVCQQLRHELSAKLMISILSNLPLTKKTEKNWYNCKFYHSKILKKKFCNIEKEGTLIIPLSA